MKYIAMLLVFFVLVTHDGCGSHGIWWTLDDQRHTFLWGAIK